MKEALGGLWGKVRALPGLPVGLTFTCLPDHFYKPNRDFTERMKFCRQSDHPLDAFENSLLY